MNTKSLAAAGETFINEIAELVRKHQEDAYTIVGSAIHTALQGAVVYAFDVEEDSKAMRLLVKQIAKDIILFEDEAEANNAK